MFEKIISLIPSFHLFLNHESWLFWVWMSETIQDLMIRDIGQILTCGRLSPCSRTWWCAWTRSPFQEIKLRPFLAAASPPATNALQTAPAAQTWASRGHSETQTVTNYKQSRFYRRGKPQPFKDEVWTLFLWRQLIITVEWMNNLWIFDERTSLCGYVLI